MSTGFWIVDALLWGFTGISAAIALNKGMYLWAQHRVGEAKRAFDPEANLFDKSGNPIDPKDFAAVLKRQQERAAEPAPEPEVRFSGPGANTGMKDMDVIRHPFDEGKQDGQST